LNAFIETVNRGGKHAMNKSKAFSRFTKVFIFARINSVEKNSKDSPQLKELQLTHVANTRFVQMGDFHISNYVSLMQHCKHSTKKITADYKLHHPLYKSLYSTQLVINASFVASKATTLLKTYTFQNN